jgi:hypothetical protein
MSTLCRERERPRRYSDSDERGTRKYTSQHDDRIQRNSKDNRQQSIRDNRGHLRSRKKFVGDEEDSDGDKNRRGWQSERVDKVSVFDRLSSGFPRNQQREERQVMEVETDPCDVPRGKGYFEVIYGIFLLVHAFVLVLSMALLQNT